MKIGMIGLGKLGLPVAVAFNLRGHDVIGYDPFVKTKSDFNSIEAGPDDSTSFAQCLNQAVIRFSDNPDDVVKQSEIIFVAVQTPHDPKYEGVTKIPDDESDFDYKYLKFAVSTVAQAAMASGENKTVVIISTVLPGTIRREIKGFLNENVTLVYNPFFIAMGTVMKDVLNPEFVLLGTDSRKAPENVKQFYKTLHNKPLIEMSIESAELTKVAYNTYIGMKIAYANTLMEICDKIEGCDVNDVTNAIGKATDRLISPKYLTAGMGDGGGCHPRDNIAMSYLAKKYDLSHNIFYDIMKAREDQARHMAGLLLCTPSGAIQLPKFILGYAFKAETKITTGSSALLTFNLLKELYSGEIQHYDPFVDTGKRFEDVATKPYTFLIGCKHEQFKNYKFPKGSHVIDPHRYIPDQDGVVIHRIGEAK